MNIEIPRSPEPRVSIIIPASSVSALLFACLRSLERFGPRDIPYQAIVVLNQTSEHDAAQLRAEVAAGIEVVSSRVNLGLAGAGNRGRSFAKGDLLVLLHDDAEIEPGWLEALVQTADAHPEAGAVGGKVLYPDARLQDAGMILWRDATTSAPWMGEAPAPTAFPRLRAVDYCGTSSLLVRRSAWDAVGGLDERFYPAYYVDVDLSMALRQRRWVVLYEPASRIRHHRGASGSPAFRTWVSQRNRRRFLQKWAAALEAHEQPPASEAAIERAMARAEAFAESCRQGAANQHAVRSSLDTFPLYPFDASAQDERLRKASRELRRARAAEALRSWMRSLPIGKRT